MNSSEQQQIIQLWNQVHSVSEVSDAMGIPTAEVRDVLKQAKGQTLYLETT